MQMQTSVFISYRRSNVFHARAVYQDLRAHGYDVFLDYESIDSGAFEQIILNQIAARAHFLVVLTPSALERCTQPGDWLRREIEFAIDHKRNVVPLLFEGFNFNAMQPYLAGKLALLPRYNGLRIPADYFDEAMARLRGRFLNKPLDVILHPTPDADEAEVQRKIARADAAPAVTEQQLSASEYFERGYRQWEAGNQEAALENYHKALQLDPTYLVVYVNRANVRHAKGDYTGALADCEAALQLDPQYAPAYLNRGRARFALGDVANAMADYNAAIHFDPQYALAYHNRGWAKFNSGDIDGAIEDYSATLRFNPQDADAYNNRGWARQHKGDIDGAIADYEAALRLNPGHTKARINRDMAWQTGGN